MTKILTLIEKEENIKTIQTYKKIQKIIDTKIKETKEKWLNEKC